MKIFAFSNKDVQEIIRSLDKKSNYKFPYIEPPEDTKESEKNENTNDKEIKVSQAT